MRSFEQMGFLCVRLSFRSDEHACMHHRPSLLRVRSNLQRIFSAQYGLYHFHTTTLRFGQTPFAPTTSAERKTLDR